MSRAKRGRRALCALGSLAAVVLAAPPVAADEPPRASFALVVGANVSVDKELPPLRYADDDAARYFDLFRLLGARTTVLARLDENTRRLHPQAAAEAREPRKADFEAAITQLAEDVSRAASRGVETTVYLVYAGHGNVEGGRGYVTFEDARLTGSDLARPRACPGEAHSRHRGRVLLVLSRLLARRRRQAPRGGVVRDRRQPVLRPAHRPRALDVVGAGEPRVGRLPGRRLQPRGALGALRSGRRRRRRRGHVPRARRLRLSRQRQHPQREVPPRDAHPASHGSRGARRRAARAGAPCGDRRRPQRSLLRGRRARRSPGRRAQRGGVFRLPPAPAADRRHVLAPDERRSRASPAGSG